MHRSTNRDEALDQFEAGVLPEPFDHRAHVVTCWRFLRVYGTLDTLERLPAALKRAVAALGVPERYHATLTWAWILEVAERLDDSPDPDTFLARHPELLTDRVRARYGELLGSPEARARFVLPSRWTGAVRRDHAPILPPHTALQALHDAVFEHGFAHAEQHLGADGVLWTVEIDGALAGFKLGYPRSGEVFHSTLGAVQPEHRGKGIARAMLRAQHQWAEEAGYRRITTSTRNHFQGMLRLDLAEGFQISGTEEAPEGGVKILLAKELG